MQKNDDKNKSDSIGQLLVIRNCLCHHLPHRGIMYFAHKEKRKCIRTVTSEGMHGQIMKTQAFLVQKSTKQKYALAELDIRKPKPRMKKRYYTYDGSGVKGARYETRPTTA